jgi:abortive infection bacteriophage resistance protein
MRTSAGCFFMNQTKFTKPAISIIDQLELLRDRGLSITNPEFAIKCLQNVSYYRLSVYFKPYQDQTNRFLPGTSFEVIWNLYSFDRELRLLMIDGIERVEIAFRAAISNYMCLHYGNTWYLKSELFKTHNNITANFHDKFIKNINDICRNHYEDFLQHFYLKYSDEYPPFWMIAECFSFGTISLIFKNLRHMKDKNNIARIFGFHATLFESWIESIVLTRNICAHHARLWNKWFVFCPKVPANLGNIPSNARHKVYEQILIISLLLRALDYEQDWMQSLFMLFTRYALVPKEAMGFLPAWQQDVLWPHANKLLEYAPQDAEIPVAL